MATVSAIPAVPLLAACPRPETSARLRQSSDFVELSRDVEPSVEPLGPKAMWRPVHRQAAVAAIVPFHSPADDSLSGHTNRLRGSGKMIGQPSSSISRSLYHARKSPAVPTGNGSSPARGFPTRCCRSNDTK